MTLLEAIEARHSVRRYIQKPLSDKIINVMESKISECNKAGRLNIQLVVNEPKCFSGMLAYGKFSGVENYIVMAGKAEKDIDERVGYYGEQLVLLAQQLGLGTCWVGLTYRKVKDAYKLNDGEKIKCVIALGYPAEKGHQHKTKTRADVSNAGDNTPSWFAAGVDAALKAPTAINQQKFFLEYNGANANGVHLIRAKSLFSIVGYTRMDLGIAKLHFEIGASEVNFEWC